MGQTIIGKFSSWFVTRWRVTVLLLIGLLAFGSAAYTSLLKREGFPPVAVPIVIANVVYPVDDVDQVVADVTIPLEQAIGELESITNIQSTSTENSTLLLIELEQDTDTKDALRDMNDLISREADLPETVSPNLSDVNAGSLDGENDLLIALYGKDDQSLEDLQEKAEELVQEIDGVASVQSASVNKLLVENVDPRSGAIVQTQTGFNRVSFQELGDLVTKPAVAVGIKAKGDVGAIELSDAVKEVTDTVLKTDDFANFGIRFTGDQAVQVKNQIDNLESNLLSGLYAVLLVIFLTIGLRSALLAAVFLPLVIGSTFAALYLTGNSLNTLTLFGVLLILGLVVDDAVVVVEAIQVERQKGVKGVKAIANAIDEIGIADLSGTLTTVFVFAPMLFIGGILGDFIQLIPVTVILSLVLSLLIALTIMPMLSSWILPTKQSGRPHWLKRLWYTIEAGLSPVVEWIAEGFARYTKWYLAKAWRTIVIAVLGLAVIGFGASYGSQLALTIFPPADDGESIFIQLTYDDGTTLTEAEEIADEIDASIKDNVGPLVQQVSYFLADQTQTFLQVDLLPKEQRVDDAAQAADLLREAVNRVDGFDSIINVVGAGPPPETFDFTVQIFADERDVLEIAARDVNNFLEDRELEAGGTITAVETINIERVVREDSQRFAAVRGQLSDDADTNALLAIQELVEAEYDKEKVEELGLNEKGVALDFGQEGENLESFESAGVALFAAFILLYALLVLEFNSFIHPFLILLAVPFGVAGVLPGLAATNNPISFFVMIGLIALAGITVNNTIMLMELTNQYRRDGKSTRQAMVDALRKRFRPILATTATTVLALLPLALNDPIWESLAYTLIFGLTASTLLIAFTFPSYYGLIEGIRILAKKVLRWKLF